MEQDQNQEPRPVAYDANGRPLYASPEAALVAIESKAPAGAADPPLKQHANQSYQSVHITRSLEPEKAEVPAEVARRHEASMNKFPELNLSPHEYIVSAIPRHFIGILFPAIMTTLIIAIAFSIVFNYPFLATSLGLSMSSFGTVAVIGILLAILFLIGGYAVLWVYLNNRFFLTNESVIQEIQTGLFSHKEQTVSLANIEDASYSQIGPVQTLLNYGSIRLSTEGDETTYRFDYVAKPKYYLSILNNAVEAFKNGRPVGISVEEGIGIGGSGTAQGTQAGPKDDANDD